MTKEQYYEKLLAEADANWEKKQLEEQLRRKKSERYKRGNPHQSSGCDYYESPEQIVLRLEGPKTNLFVELKKE
jgi:hypothetical protein